MAVEALFASGQVQKVTDLRPNAKAGIIHSLNQELLGGEIRTHLDTGSRLALEWHGLLSQLLNEDMSIKRLRFTEMVMNSLATSALMARRRDLIMMLPS